MEFSVLAGLITWGSLLGVVFATFRFFRADRRLTPQSLQKAHAKWLHSLDSKPQPEVKETTNVASNSVETPTKRRRAHQMRYSVFAMAHIGHDENAPLQSELMAATPSFEAGFSSVLGVENQFLEFNSDQNGPLPNPQMLQQYKQIDPRLLDLVMEELNTESKHRRDMERLTKTAGVRSSVQGLICATVLGLSAFLTCGWLGIHGHDRVAIGVVSGPAFAYLASFIYSTKSSRTERIEKEKIRQKHSQQDGESEEDGE